MVDTRKTEAKDKEKNTGWVDLSECTKLSIDERLVASDQHVRLQNFRSGQSVGSGGKKFSVS